MTRRSGPRAFVHPAARAEGDGLWWPSVRCWHPDWTHYPAIPDPAAKPLTLVAATTVAIVWADLCQRQDACTQGLQRLIPIDLVDAARRHVTND